MYKNKSLSLNACELLEILKQRIRLSLKQNAKSQLRQISKNTSNVCHHFNLFMIFNGNLL